MRSRQGFVNCQIAQSNRESFFVISPQKIFSAGSRSTCVSSRNNGLIGLEVNHR